MGKPTVFQAKILEHILIASDVYKLVLAPHPALADAMPGQFVEVAVDAAYEPLLRRPISICAIMDNGTWTLVYRAQGRGTVRLAQTPAGNYLDVLGPLGNGFTLPPTDSKGTIALVGGGVGVPPLVFLAQELLIYGYKPVALLGFAHAGASICIDDFVRMGVPVSVATDDGSLGYHGFVTSLLEQQENLAGVYSCGPLGMLRAVANICSKSGVAYQVSLEERMGCGVGACLSCVVPIRSKGQHQWHWQRVCKEGPVFNGAEVAFDAMF